MNGEATSTVPYFNAGVTKSKTETEIKWNASFRLFNELFAIRKYMW